MSAWWSNWRTQDIRALRFALGMAVTSIAAFTIAWPVAFLTALLVGKLLTAPKSFLSLQEGIMVFVIIAASMLAAMLVSMLLISYPLVFLTATTLILLKIFYMGKNGAPAIMVIMMLVAFTVVPLLGLQSLVVAFEAVKALTFASGLSIIFAWVAFALIPGGPAEVPQPEKTHQDYSDNFEAAVKSTIVVMPLFLYIYLTNNPGALIILVFVAILSQETDFQSGVKSGIGLVLGNLLGGLAGIAVYELLVAVPSLLFFCLLMVVVWLMVGRVIMSGGMATALGGVAFPTILVILNGAFGFAHTDAGNTLILRLMQLMIVAIYITMFFSVIDSFWSLLRRRSRKNVQAVC